MLAININMLAGSLVTTHRLCKHQQLPGSRRNAGEVEPLTVSCCIQIFLPLTRGSSTTLGSKQCWENIKAYTLPYEY